MTKTPEFTTTRTPKNYTFRIPAKIALSTLEGIRFEPAQAIVSLEAQSNYTLIHFIDDRQILVCKTLLEVEKQLSRFGLFIRVHRSHTINLAYLSLYLRGKGGQVMLDNGQCLPVSAGRRGAFLDAVGQYFG